MSNNIIVFASFIPKAGFEDKVKVILQGMVGPTRAEPGCERYDLFRIKEGDASFHLFETYENAAALEHHRGTEHYKRYRTTIVENLAEDIAVKVLSGIDVAD
jgi:quinol monooxygenase YgiN